MSMLLITNEAVERVKASIELTRDRFVREGYDPYDESLELLEAFCDFLLAGKSDRDLIDRFLTGQDLELPQ